MFPDTVFWPVGICITFMICMHLLFQEHEIWSVGSLVEKAAKFYEFDDCFWYRHLNANTTQPTHLCQCSKAETWFLLRLPPPGTRTWLGFPCRKPGSSTASWVWFWSVVWRSGSLTTPGAAASCRLGTSSPPCATLRPTRRTGGWSCPSTWWPTLRLPVSRCCSSWDTRRCFIRRSCAICHTRWWRRGRSARILSDRPSVA